MSASVTTDQLSILGLLVKGGPIMVPIVLLSMATVYLLIERWLYISSATNTSPGLVEELAGHLDHGNQRAAIAYADKDPSATGRMLRLALDFVGQPFREIESVMEASAEIQIGQMEKNLGYLGVIAGVAPMLGFIGTISGIINIFYNISASNDISMGIIAGGLYEKMITSGAGLIVGVTAFACYHILNLRIQRFSLHLQQDAISFIRRINTQEK